MTPAEREQIVLDNMPMVKAIAISVWDSIPAYVDLDDMIHAGAVGLLQAVDNFNPDRGVPFALYAKHRVRGYILDNLRNNDWASRTTRNQQKEIAACVHKLEGELVRTPSDSEIAERMGIPLSEYHSRVLMTVVGAVSVNVDQAIPDRPRRGGHSDSHTLGLHLDVMVSTSDETDDLAKQSELTKMVADAVAKLPERWKTVIELYYRAEMTMLEIGKVLGVNESRVSQIHGSATKRIKENLADKGITSLRNFI